MKIEILIDGMEVLYRVGEENPQTSGVFWPEFKKGILKIERLPFDLPESLVIHKDCAKKGDICIIGIDGMPELNCSIADFMQFRKGVDGVFCNGNPSDNKYKLWQIYGLDGF